jgi:hypothetical protein
MLDGVAVEIGADRVGSEALGQGLVRGRPGEAATTVPDVEPHAARSRSVRLRQDPAIVTEDARPGRGERVGQDVARTQAPQGRPDVRALGDVGHQPDAGQIGRLEGGVEGRRHVGAAGFAPEADLDPDDDVPMLGRDGGRLARARVAQVLQLPDDRRHEARRRHVDEGQDADRCGLDGVPPERAEVREAGRPGIDRGGHPATQVGHWVETVRTAVVPVAVQVDQPGGDQQACHVDLSVVGGRRDPASRRDRGDPSVLDQDIEGSVDTGSRVERATAVEDRSAHSPLLSGSARQVIRWTGRDRRDRTHRGEAAFRGAACPGAA